ncbi:MAG: hypothetical protein ACLFQG_08570, partial [Desulfovermiculus sp.]
RPQDLQTSADQQNLFPPAIPPRNSVMQQPRLNSRSGHRPLFAVGLETQALDSEQAPKVCKGVCMRSRSGMWWVSVPVAAASVSEEVARRGGVLHGSAPGCAVGVCGL